MSRTLLSAKSLSHSFDYFLYRNIDIEIKEAESIAIVGRSGSGKSTLLYNLSGFLKPKCGKVEIEGRDIYSLKTKELDSIRRYDIGIIFQMHYLFKGMSARENIEISSVMTGREIDSSLLQTLGIDRVIDYKISKLSGGQQQRVSIARVLNKRPKIIFADEPTGNLDIENANIVMETLLEYINQTGSALFLVTHDMSMARMCDKIYNLKDGRLKELE